MKQAWLSRTGEEWRKAKLATAYIDGNTWCDQSSRVAGTMEGLSIHCMTERKKASEVSIVL